MTIRGARQFTPEVDTGRRGPVPAAEKGVSETPELAEFNSVCVADPGASTDRQPSAGRALRYRGVSTQNSWPSGSAITTRGTSPWPMSMRVAPREMSLSTSAS